MRYSRLTFFRVTVSHHPPITAYHLENAKAGLSLEGHSAQKTSFSGRTIQVKQLGHAVLRVNTDQGEERYLITLPHLNIEGLWYGSPYIELAQTSYIQSSTGYLATVSTVSRRIMTSQPRSTDMCCCSCRFQINYTGKGYFSGKAHSFKATVAPSAKPTHALYTVEGEWAGTSKFKGKSPSGKDDLFWNADTPREELNVKPISEQGPMESRRVWDKVADGIRTANYDLSSREKTRIEVGSLIACALTTSVGRY